MPTRRVSGFVYLLEATRGEMRHEHGQPPQPRLTPEAPRPGVRRNVGTGIQRFTDGVSLSPFGGFDC